MMIVGWIKIAKTGGLLKIKIPEIMRLVHQDNSKSPIIVCNQKTIEGNKRILKLKLKEQRSKWVAHDEVNSSDSWHTQTKSM